MADANKVLNAYNVNSIYRNLLLHAFPSCFCKKRRQELKDLMFMDRWIGVSRADEPDEIKWENNGYTMKNRACRRFIIWIIAIVLIFSGATAMIYISDKTQSLQQAYGRVRPCDIEITKKNEDEQAFAAYIDFTENNK